MWLSKKTAGPERDNESPARLAEITIGGEKAAALSDGESRSLDVLSVGGIAWKPAPGQQALVIDCADGAAVVCGAVQGKFPEGMAAGEIYIESGGASVYIKNNGDVIVSGDVGLTGDVQVAGNVSVTGSMTLNGLPVAVVLPI